MVTSLPDVRGIRGKVLFASLFFCVVGVLSSPCALAGMTSTDYSIPRDVVSGGGSVDASGGSYSADDVVAQSGPVGESNSIDYAVQHGYLVATELFPNAIFSAGLLDDSHARGVAWTDVDGDGDWDLYVTRGSGAGHQDYVFINNGNGTFTEESAGRIGTEALSGYGVAFADYDGDGDLDGYVQNDGASGFLWRNDGASLTDVCPDEGVEPISARMSSWGDFDGDGLVDFVLASGTGNAPALFQNTGNYYAEGGQGFVSNTTALPGTTTGVGAWADLNNDGFLDLFVAQSSGSDLLFVNDQDGTFTESSVSAGIDGIARNSQGVAFGDYDSDGYLDVYVSCGGMDSDVLWYNEGDGTFTDASGTAGVSDTSDGRSCTWFDVDNDTDLDIYVANAGGEQDILYVNNGGGTFRKLPTGKWESSYGCAVADYDNDGDLDIMVTGDTTHFTLYRNECRNHNHIRVRPADSLGNMACFGAQVLLRDHLTGQLAGMLQSRRRQWTWLPGPVWRPFRRAQPYRQTRHRSAVHAQPRGRAACR